MLDFRALLAMAFVDAAEVLLIRHTAQDPRLAQILPWLVHERPELFTTYQRIQWRAAERSMLKARYVAAFIGLNAGEAVYAGLSRIVGHSSVEAGDYEAFPGNAELMGYGMRSDRPDEPVVAFDLEAVNAYADWIGRLTVAWSPGQSWARWADRSIFEVKAISTESQFVSRMPVWQDLSLTWEALCALPRSWGEALAQWRGVYFIYDVHRRAAYVGSAYGAENILGRWRAYAASGHGGNRDLRDSRPEDLRFSILQRTSPDLDGTEVIQLEASWKKRLLTREFGLNAN